MDNSGRSSVEDIDEPNSNPSDADDLTSSEPDTAVGSMGEGSVNGGAASELTASIPVGVSLWSKIAKIFALFAAVTAFVTGVISILPIIFTDESSTDSLEVSMKPYRAGYVSHFALPVDAPIQLFPPGGSLCSPEQEVWLQQYGVQFQRDYVVELRNSAGGGGSLAVNSFRGVGTSSDPAVTAYTVECDKVGEGGIAEEPARLLLDSGDGAFFDRSVIEASGIGQPNSPLAYNLRPGEIGQVVLTLASLTSFEGGIEATVASGDKTTGVNLTPAGGGPIRMPGVLSPRTILISVQNGELICNATPNASAQIKTCATEELFGGQRPTSSE